MARFVCNEYGFVSVTKLLENLSWPTLQQRRTCNRGIMLYKIPTIFIDQTIYQQGVTTVDLFNYNAI